MVCNGAEILFLMGYFHGILFLEITELEEKLHGEGSIFLFLQL